MKMEKALTGRSQKDAYLGARLPLEGNTHL